MAVVESAIAQFLRNQQPRAKNGEILDAAYTQMDCFGALAGNSGPSCADVGPGPARRADTGPGRYVNPSPARRADLNRDPHPAAQVP
jgi:hypothetical protein